MILNVSDTGEGPPVVLLHGLFGRLQNLGVVARALAGAGRRVIAMDLRNHGASGHAAAMDYASMAGDVMQTLSALSVSRAALLGHSMGGKVAMAAALLAPSRVERLVVADIAPVAYAHANRDIVASMQGVQLRAGMTRGEVEHALAGVVEAAPVRSFLAQNFVPGATPAWRLGLREIAAAMDDIEGWPAFSGRYEGAALFVAGGLSDYLRPADLPAVTALFPRAELVTLAGVGHWVHAEAAEAFFEVVEGFLRRTG